VPAIKEGRSECVEERVIDEEKEEEEEEEEEEVCEDCRLRTPTTVR